MVNLYRMRLLMRYTIKVRWKVEQEMARATKITATLTGMPRGGAGHDQVADGADFDSSAKELFGEHYDDFMAVYSDSDARDENRKITVSDYVNLNGLDVNYYQDYGWDPVELYRN